ncbi:MAG: hypothetical protein KDD11_05965 [Acidobacteria bacterium]|nr:hypothetical protein [Acidobacteriota bacterium]
MTDLEDAEFDERFDGLSKAFQKSTPGAISRRAPRRPQNDLAIEHFQRARTDNEDRMRDASEAFLADLGGHQEEVASGRAAMKQQSNALAQHQRTLERTIDQRQDLNERLGDEPGRTQER